MSVLVTGGAGYIGSHVVWRLIEEGHEVVVVDDLSSGRRAAVHPAAFFQKGDAGNSQLVCDVIARHGVDAVIHMAASINVSRSMESPLDCYRNNSAVSRRLIEACVRTGVRDFVFASSASVYGEGRAATIQETATLDPASPYGRSKLITEWMLEDAGRAHGLRHVSLRYFNVAGSARAGADGWSVPGAPHLIARANKVALGQAPALSVFGTDYPTRDGTCVRDYIHIADLGDIHLKTLEYLRSGGDSTALNCGYGRGVSVRDAIGAVERVSGHPLPVKLALRRAGDPAAVVADSSRLRALLGWKPRHDDIEEIVRSDYEREKLERMALPLAGSHAPGRSAGRVATH